MKSAMWLVVLLVLGGIAAGYYYYWQMGADQVTPPPVAEAPPTTAPVIESPVVHHPIENAQLSTDKSIKLPPLSHSDDAMRDTLIGFFGKKQVEEFFGVKDIVRRFVVTVDNLPRKKVPMRYRLFNPVAGKMHTSGTEDSLSLSPDNYLRYKPYVLLANAVDINKLAAIYIHLYPLFQEEYQNLGYPKGYFNDRLVAAIDDLLATPDAPAQVRLIRPNVLYQFADPDLEALSAGQKILIRMGPENAARIKARLRALRREVTGQPLPQP
ncbi:MAG: DUF3014 domain-containing protein [Sulfuricaulis sp.]